MFSKTMDATIAEATMEKETWFNVICRVMNIEDTLAKLEIHGWVKQNGTPKLLTLDPYNVVVYSVLYQDVHSQIHRKRLLLCQTDELAMVCDGDVFCKTPCTELQAVLDHVGESKITPEVRTRLNMPDAQELLGSAWTIDMLF